MFKVLTCAAYEHDLRLVALAATICALGSYTTAMLMARFERRDRLPQPWLAFAAVVFGLSLWSLHFVSMLAFKSGLEIAYDLKLTALSGAVAVAGTFAALSLWHARMLRSARALLGGCTLGLAIGGMHYLGVAAMILSGLVVVDPVTAAGSIVMGIGLCTIALQRASNLRTPRRRFEVSGWLSLAVCSLHCTGMSAITVVPGAATPVDGAVVGTTTVAFAVGIISLIILIASFTASMVERHMTQRALQDLARMRLLGNLAHEVLIIQRDGIVLE